MFVDQLNMCIAAQQHGEIIKPCDNTLQFHAVYEKHSNAHLLFADFVQEDVLDVLIFFGHFKFYLFFIIMVSRSYFCPKEGLQVPLN